METSDSRAGRLGVLWAVYGVVRLLIAIVLVLFSGIATVMFGALLTRVPNPFALMSNFHFLYLVLIAWSVASGVFALLSAGALFARMGSARRIAIVAAFLALPELPFGIMLGVYTLVVLLPSDSGRL
jgi:hypothetical protein